MIEKIKSIISNEVVSAVLWVGVSAAISAIGAEILQRPELASWYGVVNIVLYALKVANDRRKAGK